MQPEDCVTDLIRDTRIDKRVPEIFFCKLITADSRRTQDGWLILKAKLDFEKLVCRKRKVTQAFSPSLQSSRSSPALPAS
jgi:hypothetical protein